MIRFRSLLAVAFAAPAAMRAQSGLAYDFALRETVAGQEQSSAGHALIAGNKVRMDIVGPSSFARFGLTTLGDSVSIISADTGEAQVVTMLAHATKEYIQFTPLKMIKSMKELMAQMGGGPQLDFTGSKVTVDSLGAGDVIAGHATLHYRVTVAIRTSLSGAAMSQQDIVNDYYIAPDLNDFARGNALLTGTDDLLVVPGIPKAFSDDLSKVSRITGAAMALRVETTLSGQMFGAEMSRKQTLEVTSVKRADVPASSFVVPAGYKRVVPPGMEAIM